MPRAAILGCAGTVLSDDERALFAATPPLGFILFARNLGPRAQIAALVDDLRRAVGRTDAPVLIDQEGGRVARLRGDGWWNAPPAAQFGALAQGDRDAARRAVRANARLIADDLAGIGIDVDCAPVLDLGIKGAHLIIGDRAYGGDPLLVADLGRAACEGFLDGGVLPVVKHVPGHGRAGVDSHEALPVVTTPRAELEATDFAPFRLLADTPVAMTAHVVYADIDPVHPATVSPRVIAEVIRGHIGFDGVLLSDDLGMHALSGSLAERVGACLDAGCDVALHCSGRLAENATVLEAAPPLAGLPAERWARASAARHRPAPFDRTAAAAEMAAVLGRNPA